MTTETEKLMRAREIVLQAFLSSQTDISSMAAKRAEKAFLSGANDHNLAVQSALAALSTTPEGDYSVPGKVYEAAVKGRQDFRNAFRAQHDLLTARERQAIEQIGQEQELSFGAVLRQAVRLYQLHHERLKAGETVHWSGDEQRARDFAGPLANTTPDQGLLDEAREALQLMLATYGPPGSVAHMCDYRGKHAITTARDVLTRLKATPQHTEGGGA